MTQSRRRLTIDGTILRNHDFVVLVRRPRRQGRTRLSGAWEAAAVVGDRMTATAAASLIRREQIDLELRVVSGYEVLHKIDSEDRDRILDRLNGRTTAEIKRSLELRDAAQARIASYVLRSDVDRRSGQDRRTLTGSTVSPRAERRSGSDRRSGRDRREYQVGQPHE